MRGLSCHLEQDEALGVAGDLPHSPMLRSIEIGPISRLVLWLEETAMEAPVAAVAMPGRWRYPSGTGRCLRRRKRARAKAPRRRRYRERPNGNPPRGKRRLQLVLVQRPTTKVGGAVINVFIEATVRLRCREDC